MIKSKLQKLIIDAVKERDHLKADVYRMVKTLFMEFETHEDRVKDHKVLDDNVQEDIVRKMIVTRNKNVALYTENGRSDLAEKDGKESEILQALLPPVATKEEVEKALNEEYPDGIDKKQMGSVIKAFKERFKGFDGGTLANLVKSKLI